MFGAKKRRRRLRRSELRLGAQAINYEATKTRSLLSLGPLVKLWYEQGAKICGILTLTILIWIFYALFVTPSFYVYGADIRGNSAVSTREIYTISGIDSQSVFWVNSGKVSEKIASLPNIKTAKVSVVLPSQVFIEVVERRPQLLWQVDDSVWWVDQDGTIVPPRTEVDNMLRIIDDDRQPVEVGFQVDPTIIKGAQALRLLAPDVLIIRHTRALGLIVATPEGWPVYLGDGADMRAKIIVLSSLVVNLRENEVSPSYIDLRNPLRPVYKELPVIRIAPLQPTPAGQPPPAQPSAPAPRQP